MVECGLGDLVKHRPSGSTVAAIQRIYSDWGHEPDFNLGVVIDVHDEFGLVLCTNESSNKPRWYKLCELEILSAAR